MKRRLWQIAAGLAGLLVLASIGGVLVVRSGWFLDYLQRRIVEEAQRATGAKVELGSVSVDWTLLRARVNGLVLHGKETAGEAPLLRVDSATLGLRIISVFERKVDLQSLRVDKPQVRVVVYPDGTTNIPGPGARPQRLWSEDLLNIKIGEYEITGGTVEYDNRSTPLALKGENLRLHMTYDARGPAYRGELSSDKVLFTPSGFEAFEATLNTNFVLEGNRIQLSNLKLNTDTSSAELNGTLDDLRAPHGTLSVRATTAGSELVRRFKLPIRPVGSAAFNGDLELSFANGFDYHARGRLVARGLAFTQDRLKIENADLRGDAEASPSGAVLRQFVAQALGATVNGEARLDQWRALHVAGAISNLNMRRAAGMLTDRPVAWNGTLAGTFIADMPVGPDQRNATAQALLNITPLPEGDPARGDPLTGHVDLVYDQARGTLALGSSAVATSATQLEVSGTLGATLRVRARTTRLDDVMPALALAGVDSPDELPLKLNNGSVEVDGTVTGTLADPRFQGKVAVVNGQVREYAFDRFAADLAASEREVVARNIVAVRGMTEATGTATITARAGVAGGPFSNAEIVAQLSVRNASVAELAREAGVTQEVSGVAAATLRLTGSIEQPEAVITVDVANPALLGEKVDRLRANIRYSPGVLEVSDGVVNDTGSEVRFNASYRHPTEDWRSGEVTFDAATQNLPSARVERAANLPVKASAIFTGNVRGTGRVNGGAFTLTSATADVASRDLVVDGQAIGNFTLQAETQGTNLTVNANGNVRESRVDASGAWRLEGDSPGTGTVRFSRISVATLHQLVMMDRPGTTPPTVEGFVEGDATVTVALQKMKEFKAEVRLARVELNPKQNPAPQLNLQPQDVVLRNSSPVILDITADAARVRSAKFTGRNTSMDVSGTVPLQANGGADLAIKGTIDLGILVLLRPDLVAQGTANVEVAVRGSLQDPNVNGRLEVSKTTLYLEDLPTLVVENASGTILFDRNRATIQKLSADTGNGGSIEFAGFVEFGTVLVYRTEAHVRRFRVRYPQSVYTTFDADLKLNGTSEASTLGGSVTLLRTNLNVGADLGQLLADTSQPAAAIDSSQEYLRGMQLEVRVQSATNFQLETPLATEVEADIDLRLRGTPSRPALLGTVEINRGIVQVFGNQYTLERGIVRFLNPLRIDPTFDINLSTRARGVTVNIGFSGPLAKIVPNYSSDPPLLPSEIVALLAVGRDPSLASNQTAPGVAGNAASAFAQTGSNLLGQAASAQLTNRAQRFFGAARVKIDPTLTGVDNLPQARLTLEQQVSKDITMTYITNLNRTQEQIVRVQVDLSKEWSAIAVRDQNGLFGIDFQFRKRF
ncbi:MAG: translocation/assembly module TamB domain-containing protein [Acidobacteriota bacterium]